MAENKTNTKLTPGVVSRMAIGAIFIAFILVLIVVSNGNFFKGSLQNIPVVQNNSDEKTGVLIVEYIKIPDKNEIQIGSKEESLGMYLFKTKNEPINIEAITFEMEGNIVKENFLNLKLKVGDKVIENAEFLWASEESLLVDLSSDNVELKDDVNVELMADIDAGEPGQMFAFHFVDIDAKGSTSGNVIESIGVNGSATPMPQIHILK